MAPSSSSSASVLSQDQATLTSILSTMSIESTNSSADQADQNIRHATFLTSEIASKVSSVATNKSSLRRLLDRFTFLASAATKVADSNRKLLISSALLAAAKSLVETIEKLSNAKFMYSYVNKDTINSRIAVLSQTLHSIANDLSLAVQLDQSEWAQEDREDRRLDLEELDHTLQHLVDNDYKILNALELQRVEYLEAIDALQKGLVDHIQKMTAANGASNSDKGKEVGKEKDMDRIFMERALACLRRSTTTDPTSPTTPPPWTLTSWEIDIHSPPIATGGFAEVLSATWLSHTRVAIKRLHLKLETSRLRQDFLREVNTWHPLRHPHILPLLGACATAERPFMVMPFMERGHALQYLDSVPHEDLEPHGIRVLYQVSLGMQYLHSRGVVHGDLKAVNVLIDAHGTAHIADFGFASLKQFTTTRKTSAAAASSQSFGGTLRWMSPERLQGSPLSQPVDIYAFAMLAYEIVSNGEVPLTEIPDALVYQAVVHNNVRPQWPSGSAFRKTGPAVWRVMRACWDVNPMGRPGFGSVAENLRGLVGSEKGKGRSQQIRENEVNGGGGAQRQKEVEEVAVERLGGGMLRKDGEAFVAPGSVTGKGRLNAEGEQMDLSVEDFKGLKSFGNGTWGALINDLLPMFPAQQQYRIQQDMLLFGRSLVLPLSDIQRTPENTDFCDFLYTLKLAAGYETSTIHFIEFMETPSRTRGEQVVKANIHLALSKLGGKTKYLTRRNVGEEVDSGLLKQRREAGLLSGLWNAFSDLYNSPISLTTPAIVRTSFEQRSSDSTAVDSQRGSNAVGNGKLLNQPFTFGVGSLLSQAPSEGGGSSSYVRT
ncbi:hypothetical protein HDU79_004264 [Rhizoclosmatium sp. JEL0117]|nr:hypothetical protein HDU79_004264 [Rhizoclosmatium sp. JEL0117]